MSSSGNPVAEQHRDLVSPLRDGPWPLLAPALLVIVPLFASAFLLAVLQSFGYFPLIDLRSFTLDAYASLFGRSEFWRSLALSTWIGVASAVFSTVVGIAVALVVRRLWRGGRIFAFLFQVNLPIPHVVGALAMVHLLGQSGFLARLAHAAGIVEGAGDVPAVVFDPWSIGVVAEFVWKDAPFIALVALGVLGSVTAEYEHVAASLGASPWQRLRHVTIPLLAPAVAPASVIVFAFAFGSFEVPLLLGQSFPSALPVLAYRLHTNVDLGARPEAMALAVVMTIVVTSAALLYLALVRRHVLRRRT